MSSPRSLFLYPQPVRWAVRDAVRRSARRPPPKAGFQSRRHLTDRANQRYGTANEPPPHLGGGKLIPPVPWQNLPQKALPDPGTVPLKEAGQQNPTVATPPTSAKPIPQADASNESKQVPPSTQQESATANSSLSSTQDPSTPSQPTEPPPTATSTSEALSSILSMPPPSSSTAPSQEDPGKPPHLEAQPYVHHFDTYTLVRALQDDSAFTSPQSVTIMKAVRGLLSSNMDLARAGLVSRGDAEMDAYQFRAASGELRTEIRKRRAAADERMRADRLQLQHEVDTLGQRMTQESLTLKDKLKGMFDDRKMSVQLERRHVDNRIHELGYKITVAMNSGMRNEIEGLRFILTRRTVLALAGFVLMSLAILRLASWSREKEKKKVDAKTASGKGIGSGGQATSVDAGTGASNTDKLPSGTETTNEEFSRRVQNGENPSLVSIG